MPEEPKQITPQSLDDYLDIMSKVVFQSGMSWKVVEAKWSTTRDAFHNFDVQKVADLSEKEVEDLAKDTRVIRNHRKLAAIVGNAQKMIDLDAEFGSFRDYLRSFEDFDTTVKAMRSDFKFLGPMGIYYFLYVVKEDVPAYEEFQDRYGKK